MRLWEGFQLEAFPLDGPEVEEATSLGHSLYLVVLSEGCVSPFHLVCFASFCSESSCLFRALVVS